MANIFISYAREDSDFAELVQGRLEKAGHNPKVDFEILNVGDDWRDKLDQTIRQCQVLILIISPESNDSDYVNYEWAFALGAGLIIVPIEFRTAQIHPRMTPLQRLNFTNKSRPWQRLFEQLDKLLTASPETSISVPINATPVIKHAITALDSFNSEEKISAIETLAQIEDPLAKQVLTEALNHPVKSVRIAAVEHYPDQTDPIILPQLIEAYQNEYEKGTFDSSSKNYERYALSDWQRKFSQFGTAAISHFIKVLSHSISNIRYFALKVLRDIGGSDASTAVSNLLTDDNEWVRHEAAVTLAKIGDKTVIPSLRDALNDKSESVREAVVLALGELNDDSVCRLFLDYIENEPSIIRAAAARALGKIGDESAVPALIRLLADKKSDPQQAAVEALGLIGDKTAIPKLNPLLIPKEMGASLVNEVALALIRLKDVDSIPAISKGIREFSSGTAPHGVINEMCNLNEDVGIPALADILNHSKSSTVSNYALDALNEMNTEKARVAIRQWKKNQ